MSDELITSINALIRKFDQFLDRTNPPTVTFSVDGPKDYASPTPCHPPMSDKAYTTGTAQYDGTKLSVADAQPDLATAPLKIGDNVKIKSPAYAGTRARRGEDVIENATGKVGAIGEVSDVDGEPRWRVLVTGGFGWWYYRDQLEGPLPKEGLAAMDKSERERVMRAKKKRSHEARPLKVGDRVRVRVRKDSLLAVHNGNIGTVCAFTPFGINVSWVADKSAGYTFDRCDLIYVAPKSSPTTTPQPEAQKPVEGKGEALPIRYVRVENSPFHNPPTPPMYDTSAAFTDLTKKGEQKNTSIHTLYPYPTLDGLVLGPERLMREGYYVYPLTRGGFGVLRIMKSGPNWHDSLIHETPESGWAACANHYLASLKGSK